MAKHIVQILAQNRLNADGSSAMRVIVSQGATTTDEQGNAVMADEPLQNEVIFDTDKLAVSDSLKSQIDAWKTDTVALFSEVLAALEE